MHMVLFVLCICISLTHLNLHSCTLPDSISISCIIANKNMTDCKLQEEDIIVLVKSLMAATSFKQLLLNCNVLTNNAAKQLSYTFYGSSSLKQLILSNCELEEIGLIYVANALQKISSLQHLDLSCNIISNDAAVSIASVL